MLTRTRVRSGREHIPQAKSEQLRVKQSLHRLQDPASPLAGPSITPWHSPHLLIPWKSWCRHVPRCQQKQSFGYPGKAGYADVASAHDRPLSNQGIQRASYTPILVFLRRRSPELVDGQIKEDYFHAKPATHLVRSSPAHPPRRICGPARRRE